MCYYNTIYFLRVISEISSIPKTMILTIFCFSDASVICTYIYLQTLQTNSSLKMWRMAMESVVKAKRCEFSGIHVTWHQSIGLYYHDDFDLRDLPIFAIFQYLQSFNLRDLSIFTTPQPTSPIRNQQPTSGLHIM